MGRGGGGGRKKEKDRLGKNRKGHAGRGGAMLPQDGRDQRLFPRHRFCASPPHPLEQSINPICLSVPVRSCNSSTSRIDGTVALGIPHTMAQYPLCSPTQRPPGRRQAGEGWGEK